MGFWWFGDGFWVTWGAFWRDLGPVGRDSQLEGIGEPWRRGLGTPRSQDFEDVSRRLLDSGGPGTGRAMVVMVIMLEFGLRRNQYLGLRTRPQSTETSGQSYEDLKTTGQTGLEEHGPHINSPKSLPPQPGGPKGAGGYTHTHIYIYIYIFFLYT